MARSLKGKRNFDDGFLSIQQTIRRYTPPKRIDGVAEIPVFTCEKSFWSSIEASVVDHVAHQVDVC